MSTTVAPMHCSPHDVFRIFDDGWLFAQWVVGAARMRSVDAEWPAPGSELHHSFGVWPLLIDDTTSVLEYEADRRLRLRARGWPAGEAEVLIDVEPTPTGCTVTINEDAVRGPGKLVPKPIRDVMLHARNVESLRRLRFLSEQHAAD